MNDERVSSGEVWRQVVSASSYLADLERPGFTPWDALDEAIRWWIYDRLSVDGEVDIGDAMPWDDPDPLRTTLLALFDTAPSSGAVDGHELSTVLDSALRVWLERTADRVNDGYAFLGLAALQLRRVRLSSADVHLREGSRADEGRRPATP